MQVLIAKSAGFCWGVRRAVEAARQTARDAGQTVYTDGPLIHNAHMMQALETDGVQECRDPDRLPHGATLLIRAHGVTPERHAHLESRPLQILDATCPDVAKIQRRIREHGSAGGSILILGDPGHAEVVGLMGCAGSNGHVVTGPEDVSALPADLGHVCLVSQSTQDERTFDATAGAVSDRYPDAIIANTICHATRCRQRELTALASQAQAFVVVGSPSSANTQRLARLAAERLPTHVVDNAEDLNPAAFIGIGTVAVTAGASTPDFIISGVVERLRTF